MTLEPPFDSHVGDVTVVDAPAGGPGGPVGATVGRVLVALDDGPLVADPVWTRIDTLADNFYRGADVSYGRQTETDTTDTGTATVYFNDTELTGGLFAPGNTGSPLFGVIDGAQILLQQQDPTTGDWHDQFRGVIDEITYDMDPSQVLANVAWECVDLFDYLAGCQMAPGLFGDTPPATQEGTIFYEDTAGTVDERITQALADAGIPAARYVVFTGNVSCAEASYDAGDSVLSVLRDAADAEFPGIGNIYCDRHGRFCFHGRRSRIDPDGVAADAGADAWDFQRWKVGDGAAITDDPDTAQVRVLAYSRGRRDVINAALAWPRFSDDQSAVFAQEEIPDNIVVDATSISDYGYHALPPMEDLLVKAGTTTGNAAKAECRLFADLYVRNRKDPHIRVRTITVKALHPADARASTTWAVLTRADISDIVNVTVGYPGGDGLISEDYTIEGVRRRIRPLNPEFDYMEAEFDLSPVWTDWTGAIEANRSMAGLIAWGTSYESQTNLDQYAQVGVGESYFADAQVAAPDARLLGYASGAQVPDYGTPPITTATARANGWLLHNAAGHEIMYGAGGAGLLANVADADYATAWASAYIDYCETNGLEGLHIDNFVNTILDFKDATTDAVTLVSPAFTDYPIYDQADQVVFADADAYRDAQVAWITTVGPALKAAGFYVLVNGGCSLDNDGAKAAAWVPLYAAYVSAVEIEYWLQRADTLALALSGPEWWNNWDGRSAVQTVAQENGADFWPLVYGTSTDAQHARYALGTFLLNWNGAGGGLSWFPSESGDAWTSELGRRPGVPLAAKEQLESGVWSRPYAAGIVYVNATDSTQTLPGGGSLASGDAIVSG